MCLRTRSGPRRDRRRIEVDDPVGVRHHRLVVLDDENGLAGVDEPVEQAEELFDVGEMQTRRRLVENVDLPFWAPWSPSWRRA